MIQIKNVPRSRITERRHVTVSNTMKVYLQSYLRWLYEQNEDFADNLAMEECTDFFMHKVAHPLWYQLYSKYHPFTVLVETNQYLRNFAKEAPLFEPRMEIMLKEDIAHTAHVEYVRLLRASEYDRKWMMRIAESENLYLPPKLTNADAEVLHQVIDGAESERSQ